MNVGGRRGYCLVLFYILYIYIYIKYVCIYIYIVCIYIYKMFYSLQGYIRASLVAQMIKNLPAMQETWVQTLGWEDALEKGIRNSNPLQCSCLENSMDREAWWATVHGVTKSQTWLSDSHIHTQGYIMNVMSPSTLGISNINISDLEWKQRKIRHYMKNCWASCLAREIGT